MAEKKASPANSEKQNNVGTLQKGIKAIKPLQDFWNKFNNDWSWTLSAALAYNLLLAMLPFFLALLALLGIFLGGLDQQAFSRLVNNIVVFFPSATATQIAAILNAARAELLRASGILWFSSIAFAIFNGSRFFVLIENCFGIIYHLRSRRFIAQNVMAIGMLLLFIVLVPIAIIAGTVPSLAIAALQNTPLGNMSGSITNVIEHLGGLIASYVLFQAIYIVVPNKRIRFRNSWRGAVLATLLLQLYLAFFPMYVEYFLTGVVAAVGSALILLIFFYYFAMILFLGAEINAFTAEKVSVTPNLVTLVHEATAEE
ncbi:MAG: YihY/virulence factor BrkB family protein [Chloroflexi bacterium]|nr:MAG: YihY/virulence factor BrkB family protein [Chloroflexota bacterium]